MGTSEGLDRPACVEEVAGWGGAVTQALKGALPVHSQVTQGCGSRRSPAEARRKTPCRQFSNVCTLHVRCRRCRHGVSAWICVAAPRGGTPPQTAPPPAQLGDDPCPVAHPPSAPPHATPFGGAHVCALVRLTTSVRGAPRAAPPKGKGAHIAVSATYSSPKGPEKCEGKSK